MNLNGSRGDGPKGRYGSTLNRGLYLYCLFTGLDVDGECTAIGMFSDAADLGTQSAPPIMDIRRGHISEAESEPLRAGRPCWAQYFFSLATVSAHLLTMANFITANGTVVSLIHQPIP
ncbi:unnamed protein product [Ilex paraguariensis]|uniref:Uncharacterized protein n=1 Tax=Ilex paraguariensis TaxID=185542 RepID=A0ABC8U753_9AQUA